MRIGRIVLDSPVILAPMAGITDLPYRLLARQHGAALVYSEMVSAPGLVRRQIQTLRYMATQAEDQPLMIQLYGSEPEVMAEAACIAAEMGAAGIDINMGCPVRKVTRNGAGCALMTRPEQAEQTIKQVRRAVDIPLTVKIRSGWNDATGCLRIGRIAQDCGVDGIILHPRLGTQGFSGVSNWEHIAQLKAAVQCPVIGNGDIHTPEDAQRMLRQTGCDAVMIGRSSRGRPWLFGQINHYLRTGELQPPPAWPERWQVMCKHLEAIFDFYGAQRGLLESRKHIIWYTHGLPDSSLLRQQVFKIFDRGELFSALAEFAQKHQPD